MSKTKMRCIVCGKWFQSANAREVTCPECTQKARKEKIAARNASSSTHKISSTANDQHQHVPGIQSHPAVPPKPKPAKSGTNQWLDSLSDVKVGQPDESVQRPKISSHLQPAVRQERYPGSTNPNPHRNSNNQGQTNQRPNTAGQLHGPAAYRVENGTGYSPTLGRRPPLPRQSQEDAYGRGLNNPGPRKPWQKNAQGNNYKPNKPAKPARPKRQQPKVARPKREKIQPPAPFVPSTEQVQQIEELYIKLSQPSEFDGIRTQIAQELNIPKNAVKKVIKDLRERQHIPSWWEIQTYKGSNDELEQIKAAYQPYLPIPPVGVHKLIADQLHLKPGDTYQAIKSIRTEMQLPQYNDPQLHMNELGPQRVEVAKKLNAERASRSLPAGDIQATVEEAATSKEQ